MRMKNLSWMISVSIILFKSSLFGEVKTMKGLDIMPIPAKMIQTEGKFRLSDSFKVAVKGNSEDRLYKGVTRMLRRLSKQTGLFFSQDVITAKSQIDMVNFTIKCQRPGQVRLRENESYHLTVLPSYIELEAETDIGALRGLETLLQLVKADSSGYFLPAVAIEDEPRFPWRGLLFDVSRHFMPVDVIKRNLDGMAMVKMNVLHWHLTDDQGFRVECKTFPKLHELGSDGFYYTQTQVQDIITYAADRGIRVIPEFDIPGHTTSWLVGYPELASAPGPYQISRSWGVHDAVMDPTRDETYQFLDKFFKEMADLFPDDYFHIGGDENNGKHWNANPAIQAFMKKQNFLDNSSLQSHFNRRVQKILMKYDKKMVGWDEIFHSHLPKDIVIHSWRGRESLYESVHNNYQCILSHGYYIDLIQPTDYHYLNDPFPQDAPLTEQEQKYILGGEATMWSEFVSAENIDSRIWPRTAAIAERLWSPRDIKDVNDMYQRLEMINFRLEEVGLTHEKNYYMMLRRLTGNTDISALKTLTDIIEPVKIYTRGQQREYTSYSPLTRVVDAARPDAKIARHFRNIVDSLVNNTDKDNGNLESIKNYLMTWKNNHTQLVQTIKKSPVLKEIETLSQDLSNSAAIGLDSFHYLKNQQKADSTWIKNSMEVLKNAKVPRGQSELMILSAIEKLVKKAGNLEN